MTLARHVLARRRNSLRSDCQRALWGNVRIPLENKIFVAWVVARAQAQSTSTLWSPPLWFACLARVSSQQRCLVSKLMAMISSKAKFTTSQRVTRGDACIVAYIAVDFRNKRAYRNEHASHRKGDFLQCISHCTNRLFGSHLGRPSNRGIPIMACKSTSHRRLASRDLANLGPKTNYHP